MKASKPTTNATAQTAPTAEPSVSVELLEAVAAGCARIAPAWPLDRMIAVNPYWGFVHQPFEEAAAAIGDLMGSRLLMPRAWYCTRAQAQAGAHDPTARTSREGLDDHHPAVQRRALFTDVADAARDLAHNASWNDFVVQHVSRSCAAFFDEGQALWRPATEHGLYALWRQLSRQDAGPRRMMGLLGFRDAVAGLPERAWDLIQLALCELEIPVPACADYCAALLLSVNGWAAACAFKRWDARLRRSDDESLVELLAIRLAWELLLYRLCDGDDWSARWLSAKAEWAGTSARIRNEQENDWQLQRAVEISYQQGVVRQLLASRPARSATDVLAQAVFCIDVRSEVFRRALEGEAPGVRTLGFAGFFGVPIAYEPLVGASRPQLPGLLAPTLVVRDTGMGRVERARMIRTAHQDACDIEELGQRATSTFSFVEATGLGACVSLLRRTFKIADSDTDSLRAGLDGAVGSPLKPRLSARVDGEPHNADAAVSLAAGVLRGMSLTDNFAPLIALIGHGAATCNNPQAAGLACGACGGQSGEVNARVVAALLNTPSVREGLQARGINLTNATHVVAGLHDTTTDEVELHDLDEVPASHAVAVEKFANALRAAGQRSRAERAPALQVHATDDRRLLAKFTARTRDWSEVRAEWGLARNASFIVAPRDRTMGCNLEGRSFLHEYRAELDQDGAILEGIMTAPMLVTHWINLQYYASTVDNARFGSGDKVLHNVAGANVGVFEGASGDLRIGLALQSVHDGNDWYHEPLRLSVFIEAPADRIDRIIDAHDVVRDLVFNSWLHLFRIDAAAGAVHQRQRNGWRRV